MPRPSASPKATPDELVAARRELDAHALEAPSLASYRAGVLAVLGRVVRFDAAILHALSPRVPLETGAFVGLDPRTLAASQSGWDALAVELGTLRQLADRHGIATDREAFPLGSRARARFERVFVRGFGTPSVCVAHLVLRGQVRAALVLLSRQRSGFPRASVARLRSLLPAIAVADALHERLDGVRTATVPLRLECTDRRLTERQRTLVELVAMGRTNDEIARALQISPHTARNHLARIFARVGAANRAELVRLAVLTPEPPRPAPTPA